MKIGLAQIELSYELSKQVYFNKRTLKSALEELVKKGMNENSAKDYIENFKKLYNGEVYKRTTNNKAIDYFLEKILDDFEDERLKKSLKAVESHIEYYEKKTNTKKIQLRKIINKYINILNRSQEIYPDEIKEKDLFEGIQKRIYVNSYERNRIARNKCLEKFGYKCSVCKMNFEEKYGEIGKNFIHVHHLKSLSSIKREYKVDPIEDLRPVCPNCHAMLHQKKPAYTIKELKEKLK